MQKIKVAQLQINIIPNELRKNFERVLPMIEEVSKLGANLVCLPELWLTGFSVKNREDIAISKSDSLINEISQLAGRLKIHLQAGSVLLKDDNNFYNAAMWFSPEGKPPVIYCKMHLFRDMGEPKYLNPGKSPVTVNTEWGNAGMAICYDLRFPELFRYYSYKKKVVMQVLPAEWPKKRIEHWKALSKARAIENQCWFIATGRVGEEHDLEFTGHSLVINPWGEIISEGGEKEEIIFTEIDINQVAQIREKFPVLDDIKMFK